MWANHDNIPYRQIARIVIAYQTVAIRTLLPLVECDLTRAVVLMGVVKADLIHARETSGLRARITASALAQSLARPHPTVQRHANALVRLGLCVRNGHAIIPTDHLGLTAWLATLRDTAVMAIDQWRQSGVPLPAAVNAITPELDREIVIFALAMSLSGVEYHAQENANWTELCITGALIRHNTQGVTTTFVDNHRFGMDIPPSEERVPMPVPDLAAALYMPYSSMARHVARLVERGQLDRVDDGVIVSPDWLARPEVIEHTMDSAHYVGRRMMMMQAHGFDFADPMRHHRAPNPSSQAIAA